MQIIAVMIVESQISDVVYEAVLRLHMKAGLMFDSLIELRSWIISSTKICTPSCAGISVKDSFRWTREPIILTKAPRSIRWL